MLVDDLVVNRCLTYRAIAWSCDGQLCDRSMNDLEIGGIIARRYGGVMMRVAYFLF